MIVKILDKSASFNAVRYNTKKINDGKGELMYYENFPSFGKIPTTKDIKNYLQGVSKTNSRVKKPQFHATISAKGKDYSKEQLTEIGKEFMQKMGYREQPYIIVFHGDTENNHIHIVSTRVTINGQKINHNYENIRSQKHLKEILKTKYGIDEEKALDNLLKYKVSTDIQMKNLLGLNGFTMITKNNIHSVYHRGVFLQNIEIRTGNPDKNRAAELSTIFKAYSIVSDSNLNKKLGTWSCEMVDKLKQDKDIDIIFHESKTNGEIFGYTIIDNEEKNVFKGSQIFNIKNLISKDSQNENIDNKQEFINNNNEKQDIETTLTSTNNISHNISVMSSIMNAAFGSTGSNSNDEQSERNRKRKRKR